MENLNLRLGTDIVHMPRLAGYIDHDHFLANILTIKEREIMDALTTDKRKLEFLSGRFAAKEACMKALQRGIGDASFLDFEILKDESGAPTLEGGLVSISHDGDYAIATVILCNN